MNIYLSSTKQDFDEYRHAVAEAIRQLGHTCVAMEDYVAEDQLPSDKCVQDVRRCDLYVGVFAFRYGYIPDDCEKSVTEMEYLAAKERGIKTLIFLMDEGHSWPQKYCDKGSARERIDQLREELQKEKMVGFFSTPDDLARKVTAAIVRPSTSDSEASAEPGVTWTLASLKSTTRNASDAYLDKMQDERVYLPQLYAQRLELERHLTAFLDRGCKKTGMLIIGTSGIGKTNTLCHIVKQWRDDPHRLQPDVVLLVGGSNLPAGNFHLRDVLLDVMQLHGSVADFVARFSQLREPTGAQCIIVVDGVDKHPQPDELLRQLDELINRSQGVEWLKIIVSIGEVVYGELRKTQQFIPATRDYYTYVSQQAGGNRETAEIVLGRMTTEEAKEAYNKYRKEPGFAPRSAYDELTDEVKNVIANPLFLKIVMEVFNDRRIPRRVLTANVLLAYCEKKVLGDNNRVFFIEHFVDYLYDNRVTSVLLNALARVPEIGKIVRDQSAQSPFTQLLEEQVLEKQVTRVSAILPERTTIAFTYDRLLEYLLVKRITEQEEINEASFRRLSQEAVTYLPLRGVLGIWLLAKVEDRAYEEAAALIKVCDERIRDALSLELLMLLEQMAPTNPNSTDEELADSLLGRLVTALLDGESEWINPTLFDFGAQLQRMGAYRRAGYIYERVLQDSLEENNAAGRVQAYLELGNMNVLKGDQPQAREYYQRCEEVVARRGLDHFLPPLRRGIANNLYRMGDLSAALEACNNWLEKFTADDQRQLRADVLRMRGYVLLWNFRLSEAEESFCQGETLARQIGDRYLEAYFLNNRAEIPRIRGDLDLATALYESSRRIREEIGDRSGIAMSLNNLALIEKRRGQLDQACTLLTDAVRVAGEVGNDHIQAACRVNLGSVHRAAGRLDDAIQQYSTAYEQFLRAGMKNELGIIQSNLGMLAAMRGDDSHACDEYEKSAAFFADAKNQAYAAFVFHNLAVLTRRLGKSADAADRLGQKQKAMQTCTDFPWPAELTDLEATTLVDIPDI